MREVFASYPEAIDNTQKIADMCNVDFEFGVRKLPRFDVPNNGDHLHYFRRKCYEGLYKQSWIGWRKSSSETMVLFQPLKVFLINMAIRFQLLFAHL